jgi:hypothetical protein
MTRLEILKTYGTVTCSDRPDGYNGFHVGLASSGPQEWHSIRVSKRQAINMVYKKVNHSLWHMVVYMENFK